MKQTIK